MRALELNPALAEAEVSLAFITYAYDWDWAGGERHFKRAIELDPRNVTAHYWYSLYLGQFGRVDEALVEAQHARELEPLGLVGTYAVGLARYFDSKFDAAAAAGRAALEIAPGFPPARRLLGATALAERRYADAVSEFGGLYESSPQNAYYAAWLAHAYARAGDRDKAQALLDGLVSASATRFIPAGPVAVGYLGLGDLDAALTWLERAYDERSQALTYLNSDPIYDPLRSHRRFNTLRRRVGFQDDSR